DGGEPEAGEHLERLQSVQPRPDRRVFGDVLLDLDLIEAALGQQRTRNRGQRQQEQQHQRSAHRGQRAPCVACQRPSPSHIGSLTPLTKASRTHETKSFHTPVTNAVPTRISSTPPKIWICRLCRRSQVRLCSASAEPHAKRAHI